MPPLTSESIERTLDSVFAGQFGEGWNKEARRPDPALTITDSGAFRKAMHLLVTGHPAYEVAQTLGLPLVAVQRLTKRQNLYRLRGFASRSKQPSL
jgi:hypothetical protein